MDAITKEEIRELRKKWLPFAGSLAEDANRVSLTSQDRLWLRAHRRLRLGVDLSWPPYSFKDEEGGFAGIAASYAGILSERLGVAMESVDGLSLGEAITRLKAGELDVLAAVARTKENEKAFYLTKPYISLPIVLVTQRQAEFVDRLDELKGKKIGVVKGRATQEIVVANYPNLELIPFETLAGGLEALAKGELFGFVDDLGAVTYQTQRQRLDNIKIAAPTEHSIDLCFGVRKDWPQLVRLLDRALDTIDKQERTAIKNRWIAVQVQYGTDFRKVMVWAVPAAAGVVLIILLIIIWNRRLARQVELRMAAEERFATMAANVPGAIYQLRIREDDAREFIYLSAGGEEFFDAPPQQVISEKRLLNYHPEDRDRIDREILSSIHREQDINIVGRIITGNEVKWIRVNASPTRNSEGELLYNGFMLDITDRKLAEIDYLASERKVKAMSQAVDDALVMIDGAGMVVFWNPAAERLFGYSEQEAMGRDYHTLAAPKEYHERIKAGLARFAKTGQGAVLWTTTQIIACNKQGDEFPVEVTLSSFNLEDQWFAVGTVRDITERKRAEAAIRESEQRVQTILDSIGVGVIIIDPEDHTIHDVNPTAAKMIGAPREKIIGAVCHKFICPGAENNCPITDFNQAIHNDQRILLTADGGEIPVLKTVETIVLGDKKFLLESLVDITERLQAEEMLQESQNRLDMALTASNTGLWDWRPLTGEDYHNEQWYRQLGYERSEFEGEPDVLVKLMHPDDRGPFQKTLDEYAAAGEDNYAIEFRLKAKDGSWKWILSLGRVFERNEAGQPARVIGVHLDMTERKLNEQQLAATQQRFAQIIDFLPDPTWVIDAEGKVVAWNLAVAELTGVPVDKILGKGNQEYALPFYGERRPLLVDLVTHWDETLEKKYLSIKKKREGVLVSESFHPDLRGGTYLAGTARALYNPDGSLEGAIETVRDITEQKKVEAEIKQNLDELERFSRLVVGRELKMIALKEEINALLKELGGKSRYKIVE